MHPIRESRHDGSYHHPNGNPGQDLPFVRVAGKVLSTWAFENAQERAQVSAGALPWLYLYGLYTRMRTITPSAIIGEGDERGMLRSGRTSDGATAFRLMAFTPEDRETLLSAGKIDILIPVEPILPMYVAIARA